MLLKLLYELSLFLVLLLSLLGQVLNLLHIECLLLVILGLACFLHACDVLLLLQAGVHALRNFLLLTDEVLPQLVQLFFRFELHPLSFFDGLSQALTGDLLAGSDLSLLLLNVAELRVENFVLLTLFILQFCKVDFQFGMSLLSELCLEHETALGRFIEEVGTVGEPIIAELLGNALRVGSLGALLDEVVEEAQDLEVQAFEAVVLVVVELLSYRVVVALEEVLTLLVRCLLVLH